MLLTSPPKHLIGRTKALGGVAEDIEKLAQKGPELIHQAVVIVDKVLPFLPFVLSIVEDPALPQMISKIKVLKAAHAANSPPSKGSSGPPKGIDLARALPVLDGLIWYEKHRWVPLAAGIGIVLALGGIGFGLGRLTKR